MMMDDGGGGGDDTTIWSLKPQRYRTELFNSVKKHHKKESKRDNSIKKRVISSA